MPHMPVLRVVPLERIRRHEEIDPLRVERLQARIAADGVQLNPMVCVEAEDGDLVLLDGATRTESLRGLDLPHAVVQLVRPAAVTLHTWHHVVRGCSPDDLTDTVSEVEELRVVAPGDPPAVHLSTGQSFGVDGGELSLSATLSALVSSYVGTWDVTRATEPSPDVVGASYPDWAAIVEFPILTIDDVMTAALSDDLLPAGITRFLVHERALRLNLGLDVLSSPDSAASKQAKVDRILEERARQGRLRRYEETIFVLDD